MNYRESDNGHSNCRSRLGNSELDFDAELQRVVGRIPVEALQETNADGQARAFIFLVGVG